MNKIKQREIASIIDRTEGCVSLKIKGVIPWYVDEIKLLYDVYGDDAWLIYEKSKKNRDERIKQNKNIKRSNA